MIKGFDVEFNVVDAKKKKGHVVQYGRKPYNGLLIDGDTRWLDFKVMKIPNSQVG